MSRPHNPPAGQPFEPLAVVGLGCLFPGSSDRHGYWAGIRGGKDQIGDVPDGYWNPDDYHDQDPSSPDRTYGRRGGFLTPVPFNPLDFGIAPRDLEATDTSQLLALIAARQALQDAGYDPSTEFDRSRTSVILGVTGALELVIPLGARLGHPHWWRALRDSGVDEGTAAEVVRRISDSYVSWQENSFPGLLGNVVAGRIANRLDLHGTNCVTDAACASSLAAMHLAALELHSGRSDMVVTGGVDTFNDIFMYMCFSKTPALSPTGDARPFDAEGDGTILGEGIGLVVLKRLSDAVETGDRIYARLLSIGTSSDGKGSAIYAPTASGQKRALEDAYTQANVSPTTVGIVEAHGTGTSVGDATELNALQDVFGRDASGQMQCALGSVKSQIGHTKAAAGAAGIIKAVLALHHKVQPPSIKIRKPLPLLEEVSTPFHVEEQARPWVRHGDHPRRAAVSSFGFGGSNFHAVLEENSSGRTETDWGDCPLLMTFSAASREQLIDQLKRAVTEVTQSDNADKIAVMAQNSRARFQTEDPHRISIIAADTSEAAGRLQQAIDGIEAESSPRWSLPTGIDRNHGPRRGSLAILFPGQGSQKLDMLRPIACRFPEMMAVLDDAEGVFWSQQEDRGLARYIYPPRSWNDTIQQQQDQLRMTDIAQPALGAVSLGLYRTLNRFGVTGDIFGGHSFGELTALAAAGRLGDADFHQLANFRGRLMARAGGPDAGSMLAVALPLSELERFVAQNCPDLVIANRNAPQQAVLSGTDASIHLAMNVLEQQSIRHRKLPVAAAFHSPEVASAAVPFQEVLERARIHHSAVPVFANSSGGEYPSDESEARQLLANQIARPVQFLEMIEGMLRRGAGTFLEVGPGQVLTGLVDAIIKDCSSDACAFSIDQSKPDGSDLARAIGRLAVEGHEVDLRGWDPHVREVADDDNAMVVMIGGANLRREQAPADAPSVAAPAPVKDSVESVTSPLPRETTPALQRSQEALMDAIESALEMQKNLADAQSAAEKVLESSLEDVKASAHIPEPRELPLAPVVEEVASTSAELPSPSQPSGQADVEIAALSADLIEVIASKTGYPATAIGTQLDLESDLGIDSIKRVEILSALRERRPDLQAIPPEMLGTLRSIEEIAGWYGNSSEHTAMPSEEVDRAAVMEELPPPEEDRDPLQPVICQVVADKTGYPVEAIGSNLDLEADLGIDSIKRVEILSALREVRPDLDTIPPEMLGTLRTIDSIVDWYQQSSPTPVAQVESDASPLPRESESTVDAPAAESEMEAVTLLDQQIVQVVADKTGYPAEAIGSDLDLEADLGIDSIKRVEILSALREGRPDLPTIPPELLGTLRTIDAIVAWLIDSTSTATTKSPTTPTATDDLAPATTIEDSVHEVPSPIVSPSSHPQSHDSQPVVLLEAEAVALPEGDFVASVPSADTDFPWQIVCDDTALASELVQNLTSRGFTSNHLPLGNIEEPFPNISDRNISGLIIIIDDRSATDAAVASAFRWLRESRQHLQRSETGQTPRVALVQRFDGHFGLGSSSVTTGSGDPAMAGIAGLAKCAAREWPQIEVRSIDLSPTIPSPKQAASLLISELLGGQGIEVGLAPEGRVVVQLRTSPTREQLFPLVRPDGLVVITGGARGVTAACVTELAHRYRPPLLLLGRTPAPGSEPDWAREIADDQLEQHLFQRQQPGHTPASIRKKAQLIRQSRGVAAAIEELEAIGCRVLYRSVDVRDRSALEKAIEEARGQHGPVRGIMHGAGVLADHWIEDKSDEEFARVWSTKVDPARHLMDICRHEELDFISFFSSTTARLGRKGQIDYAAANEFLNRLATLEAARRPGCRVRSIGWGPWAGGMVDEGLRDLFHAEGIELIPLREGAKLFVDKMESALPPQCIVVAPLDPDDTDLDRFTTDDQLISFAPVPMPQQKKSDTPQSSPPIDATEVVSAGVKEVLETVQTMRLSTSSIPALKDHVLDGRAVVPAAFLLEWCAGAAIHRHPGLELHGVDQFRILKGIILESLEEREIVLATGTPRSEGSLLRVPVQIQATGDGGRLHARSEVLLGVRQPARSVLDSPRYQENCAPDYSTDLFHGPSFRSIQMVSPIESDSISIRSSAAPTISEWISDTHHAQWIIDPLRIDAAFQALILWSTHAHQQPCLPCAISSLRVHQPLDSGLLETRIRIDWREGSLARARAEILNRSGSPAITLEGIEVVIDESLRSAFRRDRLTEEAHP